MVMSYNDPAGGVPSSIGPQFNTFYWDKRALIEAAREQYFSQIADVTSMPKHYGKKIKKYHYLPLLDDLNVNSQGIDANGVTLVAGKYSAIDAAGQIISSGHDTQALALAETGAVAAIADGGNLYGSSKDVGSISGKLPVLGEHGGRKNRVGYTRISLEGEIEKMGMFDEYTLDSMQFDTDAERKMHLRRERIMGANELTEDMLQIDLLNSAGVVRFGGIATQNSEITGEGSDISVVNYNTLMRLSIDLDNNRTPKRTKMITGSRMIDTATIDGARIMYVGSELLPTLKKMTDSFGNKAFIPVQKYAAAGQTFRGEVGSIDQFRIVVVPEMMHWEGLGAEVTTNEGYRETYGRYDIYPMLCVGSESFTTIGFQTDGRTVKFKIIDKEPGEETADRNDPFGETGFTSIKWWYGFMVLRPERIALIKTVAEL